VLEAFEDQHHHRQPDRDVSQPFTGLDTFTEQQRDTEQQYRLDIAEQTKQAERQQAAGNDVHHQRRGTDQAEQRNQPQQAWVLIEHGKALLATAYKPVRHRQHQRHVDPQTAEVVGLQAFAQHEVQRVTDHNHQGRPGKTADPIQLVCHAENGKEHRDFLQVRQAVAVDDAPGQHHRQRQQEIAQRHVKAITVERRPHEQPQLHAEQRCRNAQAAYQLRRAGHTPQQLQHSPPFTGNQHEHGHARHGEQHPPAKDFHAAQRGEQRGVVIHDGKQHRS